MSEMTIERLQEMLAQHEITVDKSLARVGMHAAGYKSGYLEALAFVRYLLEED